MGITQQGILQVALYITHRYKIFSSSFFQRCQCLISCNSVQPGVQRGIFPEITHCFKSFHIGVLQSIICVIVRNQDFPYMPVQFLLILFYDQVKCIVPAILILELPDQVYIGEGCQNSVKKLYSK